ncbi:GNAT family N-acetyltransferase [Enterovibrio coralii]|uniref:GNAT family N-acetyltransferase n=1 Tax=Enterovibrio coralii TaxID=294935 RepID=UPI001E334552|nr:GNAT family N-acetyltransferase [Enterovibrio coralii]
MAFASADITEGFATDIAQLLTPSVKAHLPPDVYCVVDTESAKNWLTHTLSDALLVPFYLSESDTLAGFFLLYVMDDTQQKVDVRLGYVVAETFQGKGLASEIIEGLVAWCRASDRVASLAGGAEQANAASIRVLEKNGFTRDTDSEGDTVFLSLTF